MKNFKTYTTISAGLMIMMVLLLAPISESKSQYDDGIKRLIAVTQMQAQTASDEALEGAEKQRSLVKQHELLRSPASESSKRIAGPVSSESGRLTPRELAREKAVLQQLEANARRAAEVLESVKRLAAKSDPNQVGDALRLLATVGHNHAQNASQEASRAVEKQRTLVKSLSGKAIGNAANDGDQSPQTGRLTPREVAREKAVLQQLEANARRSAEVLESVKRLVAEVDRQPRR